MADEAFPVRGPENQAFSFQFVGVVTVSTSWYGSGFLFPEFALNDLDMNFFNSGMAFGAGFGYVTG